MTLIELIDRLRDISLSNPVVNYFEEGDVYNLSSCPDVEYSAVYVTQGVHSGNFRQITYNLNIFYIDRIADNESNVLKIQSDAILVLQNIINRLYRENFALDVDSIIFTTFRERFADDCAGAFATLKISVDNNLGECFYE